MYTFIFGWLHYRNFKIKYILFETFYVGWPRENFLMSEDKICWNDSCWFVGIIFNLKSDKLLSIVLNVSRDILSYI